MGPKFRPKFSLVVRLNLGLSPNPIPDPYHLSPTVQTLTLSWESGSWQTSPHICLSRTSPVGSANTQVQTVRDHFLHRVQITLPLLEREAQKLNVANTFFGGLANKPSTTGTLPTSYRPFCPQSEVQHPPDIAGPWV